MPRLRADRKFERQQDAIKRLADWQSLTPTEQIQDLDLRGVTATKQRARILRQIEEAREATVAETKKRKAVDKPRKASKKVDSTADAEASV